MSASRFAVLYPSILVSLASLIASPLPILAATPIATVFPSDVSPSDISPGGASLADVFLDDVAQLKLGKPSEISQVFPIDPPEFPPTTNPARLNEPAPIPPLPDQVLPPLPPPEDLLPPQTPAPAEVPEAVPGEVPNTVLIKRFRVEGSTVFSAEELAQATAPFEGRNLSFAELLQVRSVITQLYVDQGYVTSGAFIPPQTMEGGVITIQVVEGSLEDINVSGTRRLRPDYIRSRLAIAASTPLNTNRLLEGLRLLQLNPLVQTIAADLQAGTRPGTSLLQVQVQEADTFSGDISLNNGRSPSVGSFRRGVQLTEANLLGLGDSLSVGYSNTDGSNQFNGSYTLPLNPRNGTLQFSSGATNSRVIEPPFTPLDIIANSRYYEITLRQPLYQTSTEELALGLTASRQESKAEFSPGDDSELPFPSQGADEEGRTRISALRFFQEWTKRSSSYVLAGRSQFSLGLDLLDSTVSDSAPDSRFFAWRGQGQWVRLLAPDTLLLVRADAQIATSLVPLEQFSLGGQDTLRGYRQDFLLSDNGVLFSTEVRIPVLRVPQVQGVLQIVPFLDVGTGWNSDSPDPNPSTLVGAGLGLLWRQSDYLTARLDWGIPLVAVDRRERTWQESGVYFSIVITPF
ncbi:MAG: ShlB/FhaC/HecB family hemolysin secretion/activation protein [Drouetiella hepatica Uher 2000/2452]|jgi:hemolysin activation/secretion protein|uniref:ShlB/FhaC/HecB family hemolysin secretion/activation protein n=1 Tax=Drouetiella hepatica Uher 2000/2452 TaxID=904376 RepID=A0A951UNM5_9CYAN|nr:ShlB/FhaC/HecB family hemolysin secretion/activation protein [Drouetiella hepatica Uher 2000/2452]